MSRDKLRGDLFENMVLLEILKYQYNHGRDANVYFYRDSHQNKADIILQMHDKLIPIEIKSSATFDKSLLKSIKYFQKLVPEHAPLEFLIYAGEQEQKVGDIEIINFKSIDKLFHEVHKLVGLDELK